MAIRYGSCVPALAGSRAVIGSAVVVLMALIASGVLVASAGAAPPTRFSAPVVSQSIWGGANRLVAAELDGDGIADLVTADGDASRVSVQLGKGDGRFYRRAAYRARGTDDVAVTDVSGDGWPDLVAVGSPGSSTSVVTVLLNNGAGGFRRDGAYTFRPSVYGADVAVADVNGDTIVDVVVAAESAFLWDFAVLLGTGGGQFAAAQKVSGRGGRDLAVADFNNDGRVDVTLAPYTKRAVALRSGLGDGTFGPARTFGTAREGAQAVSAANLNHDGKMDLAVVHGYDGGLSIFLGLGDGTFTAQARYAPRETAQTVEIADFNNDGIADVVTGDWANTLTVHRGRGDGTLHGPQHLPTLFTYTDALIESIHDTAVADFNRDGRPDLAIIHLGAEGPSVTAVLLNTTGLPAAPCVVVPLTGERVRRAKRHVVNAGCRVGQVRYRYSRKVRHKRVISQRPRFGAVFASRAAVDLVVSRGRRPQD